MSSFLFDIAFIMKTGGMVGSTREAQRLIEQGGVYLDNMKVPDRYVWLESEADFAVLRVGRKKFLKIRFESFC